MLTFSISGHKILSDLRIFAILGMGSLNAMDAGKSSQQDILGKE